nr:thioesterase family protein [uncultured Glaciecola sp.]
MHIDELLALAKTQKYTPNLVLTIPSSWSQGRTVYGGLSAGLLYAAAREHVGLERVMRSNSTNFVGPLIADQPFTITVEILREGKNVSQVMVRAIQDDKICVVSQICFGNSRESAISVPNKDTHNIAPPINEAVPSSATNLRPEFLKHIDLSIQEGGWPFSAQATSHYHGWMRFKKAPITFTDAHLISIIDAWPPTLIQMLSAPAPASSVSWSLEFIHPHRSISGNDWLAYKAHTRQAANGYGHTEANIWDKDGELIAISRQTVAIFD